MSLILNSTIQQLIVNSHTNFKDSSFNSAWENCGTNFLKKSYGITASQPDQILYRSAVSKRGYKKKEGSDETAFCCTESELITCWLSEKK